MSQARRQTDIKELIIHCAATPNGVHFSANDIDGWHHHRGFRRNMALFPEHRPDLKAIGYHQVIRIDGSAEAGRHLLETGAHCLGHNMDSIGVCLIGTDKFYPCQWDRLKVLVEKYKRIFPFIKILGHRDTSPDRDGDGKLEPREWLKTCPEFAVSDWLDGGMGALDGHVLELK